jgi:hypothetical protein
LSASEENSQIAKSVLVDLIDCSGVDFNALEPLLSELLVEVKKFGGKHSWSHDALSHLFSKSRGNAKEPSALRAYQSDGSAYKKCHR